MDWPLIRRGVFWYSLVAGGRTVALISLVFGTGFGLLFTFVAGLLVLLYVVGGTSDVRTGTIVANTEAGGLESGIIDHREGMRTSIPSDVKFAFYAVGLLVSSIAVAVGTVIL